MKTLVLGLGNPILSDDGVGVRVAEAVRASLPPDAPVDVCELSVGGLRLMEHMLGYERVILVDAMRPGYGEPGTFQRLSYTELIHLCPTQHVTCLHDTSLVTALEIAQRIELPVPREIIIYAIGVQDVETFGEELTPAVARALPEILDAVLRELNISAPKEESRGLT